MMTAADTQRDKPSVALIGFRGCGKSTVARELAELIGLDHIDTDSVIAEQAGKSIAAIFEEEGEADFRRRETEAIRKVVASAPVVVSVGGGAVLDDENVRALRSVATLIWLTAPADVLWRRISDDPATSDSRPALTARSGLSEVQRLLAERSPYYRRAADLIVDTVDAQPEQIAREIVEQYADWGL